MANEVIQLKDENNNSLFPQTSPLEFKYRRVLSSSDDLNNLLGSEYQGIYKITTIPTNAPENTGYSSLVNLTGGSWGQQMIVTSEKLYIRTYSGSPASWRDWFSIPLQAVPMITFSAEESDYNHNKSIGENLRFMLGIISNQLWLSIDYSWIRIQLKTASSGVPYIRTFYGNSVGNWHQIAVTS